MCLDDLCLLVGIVVGCSGWFRLLCDCGLLVVIVAD